MAIGTAIGAGVSVLVTRVARFLAERGGKETFTIRPRSPLPANSDSAMIREMHGVLCRKDEETGAFLMLQELRRMRRAAEETVYLLTPEHERHKLRPGSIADK